MELSIRLSPSKDVDALTNTIIEANKNKQQVTLMPGIHYTRPAIGLKIPINKNGITIKGTPGDKGSIIKRPVNAINLNRPDNNYGLFFVPSPPTEKEWRSVKKWKLFTHEQEDGSNTTFEYTVITRGDVKIEHVNLDCNMANQSLPANIESGKIEHAAMLGFSGQKYTNQAYPNKVIFVAFKSVTINNVITEHGGYADDIWITRGYFRPNIKKVSMSNITSRNRINAKRATISFSGLAQNVELSNINVFRLEAEETSARWNELPGDLIEMRGNRYSNWKLKNITCEVFDLAAKGKSIFIQGDNIQSTESTNLYQLGGKITNSVFNLQNHPTPLNRLNAIIFKKVKWIFTFYINEKGNFIGLAPRPQYGENCSATFIENEFKVNGTLVTDASTEQHCLVETETIEGEGNDINLVFKNCRYDNRFGKDDKTYIAKVFAKGEWQFRLVDFKSIPIDKALLIKKTALKTVTGGILKIVIP